MSCRFPDSRGHTRLVGATPVSGHYLAGSAQFAEARSDAERRPIHEFGDFGSGAALGPAAKLTEPRGAEPGSITRNPLRRFLGGARRLVARRSRIPRQSSRRFGRLRLFLPKEPELQGAHDRRPPAAGMPTM